MGPGGHDRTERMVGMVFHPHPQKENTLAFESIDIHSCQRITLDRTGALLRRQSLD
jgi:hypothetical protein